MGKALGLLPSWYWPDGVQRYLAAPRVAIYELTVNRWARRYGSDTALIRGDETATFRELDTACQRVAALCAARFPDAPPRVALALSSGVAFAPIFLGLLRANATLLLLEAPDEAALAEFGPGLVISDMPGVAGEDPARWTEEDSEPPPARPVAMADVSKPTVALPGRNGLAWHSQVSLMSAAMAFATFISLDPKGRLAVVRPPGSWEAVIGLLAPLQAGAPAIACEPGDDEEVARLLLAERPGYAWLDAQRAESLLGHPTPLGDALREARTNVFVTTTGPFPRYLRRALRHRLRTHVLTVYGFPECGPVAASHPSWYLDDAVGIPMVGVDLLALDPATSQPSELPWSVLSYASIGAKTQAVATNCRTGLASGSADAEQWYVTGAHGILDANGMLFLKP